MNKEIAVKPENIEERLANPAHKLVAWYRGQRRSLPWRETSDPYAIWVSETMLQQTRVDTVIPYYQRFLAAFPTVSALAGAEEAEVVKLWQGLGYYSRVRNLHKAAKVVVQDYDGRVPANLADLTKLPGVGSYTQGALLSIAFNQPHPAVDGNVLRVLSRFLALNQPVQSKALRDTVFQKVQDWMQFTQPADLSQGLMELGALVCTPRNAACGGCPLAAECRANSLQLVEALPVKRPKAARKMMDVVALWIEFTDGMLMQQRPAKGLLAGLWQLPSVEVARETDNMALSPTDQQEQAGLLYARVMAENHLAEAVAEQQMDFALIASERHIFSHIEWQVSVWRPIHPDGYPIKPANPDSLGVGCRYVSSAGLDRLALPRVYERIMQSILK